MVFHFLEAQLNSYNFVVKKIDLINTWKDAEARFDPNSGFDIFGIAILTRYTIEFEGLRDEITDSEWSALHAWLHPDSVEVSKAALLEIIYGLISSFKTYKSDRILRIISNFLPKPYLSLSESTRKKITTYNLYTESVSLISAKENLFLYSGVKLNSKKENKISFISQGKQIEINKPIQVTFKYIRINNKVDKFFLKSFVDLSEEFIKKFETYFAIKFSTDIQQLKSDLGINSNLNPTDFNNQGQRVLLKAVHCAVTMNPINFENDYASYLPFYLDQLNGLLPNQQIAKKFLIEYYEIYKGNSWYNHEFIDEYENKRSAIKFNSATSPTIRKWTKGDKYGVMLGSDSEFYIKTYWSIKSIIEKMFIKKQSEFTIESETFGLLNSYKSILLVGPAGHGKTYAISEFQKKYADKKWMLIAPSWKAISLYKDKMPSITSQRANRLAKDNQTELAKTLNDVDFLVIDEISMVDNWDFLKFISDDSKVIFVGDNKQIPPIGQIQSSIWLEEIARKNNSIVDLSKNENFRLMRDKHFKVKTGVQLELANKILLLLSSLRRGTFSINARSEYIDLIDIFSTNDDLYEKIEKYKHQGYRFIVQKNVGPSGTLLLNSIFSDSSEESSFNVGDIVIFDETHSGGLYKNQQEATILSIEKFRYGDSEMLKYKILLSDNQKIIEINEVDGDEPFTKSLFLTAHRAQGSSIDKVVVIIDSPTSSNWIYSASSRTSGELKIFVKSTISQKDIE